MRMKESIEAYFDDYDRINVYISNNFFGGDSKSFHLKDGRDQIMPATITMRSNLNNGYVHYVLRPEGNIEVGQPYLLFDAHAKSVPVQYSHIVKTDRFAREFTYDGDDLGMHFEPEQTSFKIWAPTADKVQIRLELDGKVFIYPMERENRGVWAASIPGNWDGACYLFQVHVNGTWKDTPDPYSFFSGPNTSCSVIVDPKTLDLPEKVDLPPLSHNTDAIIYEASVRDMTSQPGTGQRHPSTFAGMMEENEVTLQKRTGMSYLKDLGVTHVQLMPVFDFATVDETHPGQFYNWGYDPAHFRSLEGSYATDPKDAKKRVEEFAALVQAFHAHGIKVNLDLVFNHVYDKDSFSLERLVPDYYFLMNREGEFSNGSFCGNDIDSRPAMAKKYLVETAKKIVELYDVDGFRFDLMGILDTGLMNEIAAECRKLKPGFMIYGEGWDMPSFVPEDLRASQRNQGKMPLVGHFSDRFRDTVRGSNGNLQERGYASGDTGRIEEMKQVLAASVKDSRFDSPQKVINYAECHDNHTLWDKNRVACRDEGRELRQQRQVLANAMVLLAQGVPFLHAGQEFGRTKQDLGNTYNQPDSINQLDYTRRDRHNHIVKYTSQLIDIRKNHPAFRLADVQDIWDNVQFEVLDNACLVYRVSKDDDRLAVFFNPTGGYFQYTMQEDGRIIFDNGDSNGSGSRNVIIAPYSVVIYQMQS